MKKDRRMKILREAKSAGYRTLTGKPLGITGEVAEYEAARLLGVELTPARQAGYDAVEHGAGVIRRLQIKGRCLLPGCKPGQRLGSIDITKEWDAVLMVLLDENFDALEIHEAQRADILKALSAPGLKARNERGRARRQQIQVNSKTALASEFNRLINSCRHNPICCS
jgi:hypothetical protein